MGISDEAAGRPGMVRPDSTFDARSRRQKGDGACGAHTHGVLLVVACKVGFSTGNLGAIHSKEDQSLWASLAATGGKEDKGGSGAGTEAESRCSLD
jgi:hypothetical protein